MKDDIVYVLIKTVFYGGLFLLFLFVITYDFKTTDFDMICKDHGYNYSTDYTKYTNNFAEYHVECDNKYILYDCLEFSRCLKFDKWGNCEEEKEHFVCEN